MKFFIILIFVNFCSSKFTPNSRFIEIQCKNDIKTTGFLEYKLKTCTLSKITASYDKSAKITSCKKPTSPWICSPVNAFIAHRMAVPYFPQGLSSFFNELFYIAIDNCGLKEIHSSDLEDFCDLRELHLNDNQIEFIEENLLQFNAKLEVNFVQGAGHSDINIKLIL